jgi:hypothetical protein
VYGEFMLAKALIAQDPSEGLAPATTGHQGAQGVELGGGERLVEAQVELHPLELEHLGQDLLGLEARTVDPLFAEVGRGLQEDVAQALDRRRRRASCPNRRKTR